MDVKNKKSCPKCNQLYRLKSLSPTNGGNIPLFLSCGHTTCEKCITTIIKCGEPIECNICHCDIHTLTPDVVLDKKNLYQIFPVNVHMLGEIALESMQCNPDTTNNEGNQFIDLQAILNSTDLTKGSCVECHQPTTKMCKQCKMILCENCFNKSHKNFIVFKNHVLQNIEMESESINCKVHKEKPLEYYCRTCTKAICMNCLMIGSEKCCKNHDVEPIQEVNERFFEDLSEITPKVNDTFKRLTKTAVDVGNILYKYEKENKFSDLSKMVDNIEQQFSKLLASIQKHKQEVIEIVLKVQNAEKESLLNVKNDLEDSLKKTKLLLNTLNSLDPKENKMICLPALLDAANEVVQTPWCLKKNESHDDPLKVIVNDDLCALITDYVHLEGNANSVYKLYSTAELGEGAEVPPPPVSIVFPPELAADVRQLQKKTEKHTTKPLAFFQAAPNYRSKSGSHSSLNSLGSDGSTNTFTDTLPNSELNRPIQQVHPLSDNDNKLPEGSQEIIYISHIVDPHNFFVQKASHQKWVKEMWRDFRNSAAPKHLLKPSINHATEGKTYLAFNKADNMWQRCRIMNIDRRDVNNPKYQVFCYDFGSTEVVSIDMLRVIPPLYSHSPPPLAINCCLANCEPLSGAWTKEDAFLIQNIINNKQAVIHVRRIVHSLDYGATLYCDVTAFEDGTSLAHALVFHERSRMPQPKLQYPEIRCRNEKPKIFINNNDYKPMCKEEVYITHVVSPDKFFVRKRYLQEIYDKLCEDLEQEYSRDNTKIYLPEIGMWCVVHTEGGGAAWARAQVAALPGRQRVQVRLADCGRELVLHWSKLRPLRKQFIILRALATECHLAGVTPLQKKWSTGSVALLHSFKGKQLELLVEETRRGSIGVTLYEHNENDEPLCINNEMVKHKYAITFGLLMFNKDRILENQVVTSKTPLDKPQRKPKQTKTNQVKILKKHESPKRIKEEDLEAKDKGPLRLEAKLLNYQSPSQFYVSLVHQQKTFQQLYEKIQTYYGKRKMEEKTDWNVSDRCCTIYTESNTWRRAVILEIDGDKAKVFYTDFACVETVPMSNLRELANDFASIGDAAIECHLCGVIPAVGDEWPSLTKEYLKEMLDVYRRVFITKLGNFKNKSMPVELWVYHVIQGGALEPNIAEWRCLNNKIIEQGLGIPDNSQQYSAAVPAKQDNPANEEDTLSFLNITGSVRDWLQLEPQPRASAPAPAVASDESEASDAGGAADPALADTVYVTDWLPPEPLSSDEFYGVPTYIDNKGVMYIYELIQQQTLDLIRKALDVRFKDPDPKAKYQKWSVGEPCIALFYLDNRFYRGRVIEVDNETSTCFIHYIDYGNEELCSFENMRKSIALYQIPTQAHKCTLNRIRPQTGNQWDTTTLDYIHKSIVEKTCLIKVTGEAVNDITPIDLKYDKLWINDHLVEFELAVYTDGSKALKRKFAGGSNQSKLVESCQVESDSGPDYIIEDDPDTAPISHDSSQVGSTKSEGVDWNKMIDDDKTEDPTESIYIAYPENSDVEFDCNITIINSIHRLELTTIDEDDEEYREMTEQMEKEGDARPPVNGIFENKACIARFHEDGKWYRASILQYCDVKGEIKVRFVDYGNIEVVSLADAREIDENWALIPPAALSVKLYGLRANPDLAESTIIQHYTDLLLDKGPFKAKVINYDDGVPNVELRNADNELVYEKLVQNEVLIKCDDTTDVD